MRIVSRQKDYYDNVMQYGMDLSLQYIRTPINGVIPDWSGSTPTINSSNYQWHYIGFCGEVYPVIEFSPPYKTGEELPPKQMIYDMKHFDAYMTEHLTQYALDYYEDKTIPKNKRFSVQGGPRRKDWERFFLGAESLRRWDGYQKIFTDSRSPIWIVSQNHRVRIPDNKVVNYKYWHQGIVYDCLLKPFNFGKVKDAYTAFQDLRMWLSNLAAPEKPIPKMTNEEDAARLGHDSPYSFRKAPSEKK